MEENGGRKGRYLRYCRFMFFGLNKECEVYARYNNRSTFAFLSSSKIKEVHLLERQVVECSVVHIRAYADIVMFFFTPHYCERRCHMALCKRSPKVDRPDV
eukprot:g29294.t1